jgi:hypothetical protein
MAPRKNALQIQICGVFFFAPKMQEASGIALIVINPPLTDTPWGYKINTDTPRGYSERRISDEQ